MIHDLILNGIISKSTAKPRVMNDNVSYSKENTLNSEIITEETRKWSNYGLGSH